MGGTYCCIPGCNSNSTTSKEAGIKFHRFPVEPKLRQLWIDAINNKGPRLKRMFTLSGTRACFSPKPSHRVCGKHFINGRMTYDDKVPSIFSSNDQENVKQMLLVPTNTAIASSPTLGFISSTFQELGLPQNNHASTTPPQIITMSLCKTEQNLSMDKDNALTRYNDEIPNISAGTSNSRIDLDINIPSRIDLETNIPSRIDLETNIPSRIDLETNIPSRIDLETNTCIPSRIDLKTILPSRIDLETILPSRIDLETIVPSRIDLDTSVPRRINLDERLLDNLQERGDLLPVGGKKDSQSFQNYKDYTRKLFKMNMQEWTEKNKEFQKQIKALESSIKNLNIQNDILKNLLNQNQFRVENLDDERLKFYTGFEKETFDALFELLEEDADSLNYVGSTSSALKSATTDSNQKKRGKPRALNLKNELLLVLIRLRQGLLMADLAYRFGISSSTVSRIFVTWIDFLNTRLSELPIWSESNTTGSTQIILDCTEIFHQTSSSYWVQSETYLTHKSHNTAKGLISVSSVGLISFIPGQLSDGEKTKKSGTVDMLDGDVVMADPQFIEDLLSENSPNIQSILEADRLGKEKETRKNAPLSIHIERTIRRLKSFRILTFIVSAKMTPDLIKIWRVCCHLVNFGSDAITTKEKD